MFSKLSIRYHIFENSLFKIAIYSLIIISFIYYLETFKPSITPSLFLPFLPITILLIESLLTLYENHEKKKQYEIPEFYLSSYIDRNDATDKNLKYCTAPIKFTQRGLKLVGNPIINDQGNNQNLNCNQNYILDGKIHESGFYYGHYYSNSPFDNMYGTFLLKMTTYVINGHMHNS